MKRFEIVEPVVGTTLFIEQGRLNSAVLVADTYLVPLYEALYRAARVLQVEATKLPQLLTWWSAVEGPFSSNGGRWTIDPTDGLLDLLLQLRQDGALLNTDLSRVHPPGNDPPAPMVDVLDALIDLFSDAIRNKKLVEIEELP